MQALIHKSRWQQQLRESSAVKRLRNRQIEQFPLTQLQGLTNGFIQAATSSRWSLGRTQRTITPFSVDCDQLFDHELLGLGQGADSQLGIVHAGVLACIHLLSTTSAIAQLSSLMPDFTGGNSVWDELFDEKVALYLQCLIIAHHARPHLYSSQEALASKQLLRIAMAGPNPSSFPTISLAKLFGTVGPDAGYTEVLPDNFIGAVLDRARFENTIGKELDRLRAGRRWYEAYALVKALNPLLNQEQRHQRDRASALMQKFIPYYTFWAAWKPSRTRVELWKDRIPSTHWSDLAPIFDLEGPDVTGQQCHTLRESPRYPVTNPPGFIRLCAEPPVLVRVLELLDIAASVGPHSIDLLIHKCIKGGPPTPAALAQLTPVLEAARGWGEGDWISKVVKDYLAGLNALPDMRLPSLSQALTVMTCMPKLQATFGTDLDIKRTAVDSLSFAQSRFCDSLEGFTPNEALAYGIVALGHAMLEAVWLHPEWHPWYLATLRQIPSHGEVEATLRELRTAITQNNTSTREALIDHLGTKLGNRSRRNTQSVLVPDTNLVLLLSQDQVWYEPLDPDRARLREFIRTMPGVSPTLATTCVKRSREEDSTFIHALDGILLGYTDTVCVNLANFLGARTKHARFQVDECWKALLLHMMRQRPPGMLQRAAAPMDLAKWLAWEADMRRLFGGGHMDPQGQMGFTAEKVREITRVKTENVVG
ncbi:hypothetical protein MFIFM68171_11018 [Madurella fahalii]|uniref:Uncharacterized protein n=1 Tax=Madurella fahalii TaxID=1157608 RepID=A0ABQ0GST9_9PEZI